MSDHCTLTSQSPARGEKMAGRKTANLDRFREQLQFFKEFLKHPRQVGSVIPSSRFLERRIVQAAAIPSASVVVELGAGTGGTTRAILQAMSDDARLLSIEINPRLCESLERIGDHRLIVHSGGVEQMRQTMLFYGLGPVDAVVSGIPFSTMSRFSALRVLKAVFAVLAPGGCLVAYQVSNRVAELGRPIFGAGRVEKEFLNIPPLRIYRWKKRAAVANSCSACTESGLNGRISHGQNAGSMDRQPTWNGT